MFADMRVYQDAAKLEMARASRKAAEGWRFRHVKPNEGMQTERKNEMHQPKDLSTNWKRRFFAISDNTLPPGNAKAGLGYEPTALAH